MTKATADLYDEFGEELTVLAPIFSDYGGKSTFEGEIATLKVFEDNTLVRAELEKSGENKVLVIDGGGSLRCALVGDNLAVLAMDNGWSGIIVFGCVRDSAQIIEIGLGVKAIGVNPRKSVKRGEGERDVALRFAEAIIEPGEYLYADRDGIVISKTALS
jgi:regulator of ribonuclease activity A